MPLYTHRCTKCKAQVEELQKFDDPAPPECPQCKEKGTLERVMGLSNFQLKGGGWAKDGYG